MLDSDGGVLVVTPPPSGLASLPSPPIYECSGAEYDSASFRVRVRACRHKVSVFLVGWKQRRRHM